MESASIAASAHAAGDPAGAGPGEKGRATFSMARQGAIPKKFGAVHPAHQSSVESD